MAKALGKNEMFMYDNVEVAVSSWLSQLLLLLQGCG
jgi:hypothetical protein